MKIPHGLLAAVLLAGCAASDTSLDGRLHDLRDESYLRTERMLHMTFPQIQVALRQHARSCGGGPVFQMIPDQTGFATILEEGSEEQPWNQLILFDLAWLQPNMRYDTRSRVQVYSFYSDARVKQRIRTIFRAIEEPDLCPDPETP